MALYKLYKHSIKPVEGLLHLIALYLTVGRHTHCAYCVLRVHIHRQKLLRMEMVKELQNRDKHPYFSAFTQKSLQLGMQNCNKGTEEDAYSV